MFNVLVINAGSSSLKYQLLDMENEKLLAIGLCERIGIEGSELCHKSGDKKYEIKKDMKNHTDAISMVLEALTSEEHGAIKSYDEINAVGHRVVHGAESFASSVLIDETVLNAIKDAAELAPLHNPANLMGIDACRELLPQAPMVAVFDTAFHQTMEKSSFLYALPYEYYEKHKIRRYGFHGTSHGYIAGRAAKMMGEPIEKLKIITCHLGNGCSIAAVKNGKSVDTSMGFTPLEGVMMGTRSGDLDPAIVPFLCDKEGKTVQEVVNVFNKKSGLLGVSGISNDMRDVENGAKEGNERAQAAIEMYALRVKKYIGAYIAEMNGCDAIVFSGGIGENAISMRAKIASDMEFLGLDFDEAANDIRGQEKCITKEGSRVAAFIIPTNEELVIARDTAGIVRK